MRDIINRFFSGRTRSKDEAKQRLKFLLIHDQVDLTPAQLDSMKSEIMDVIQKYVEIDMESCEFRLDRSEDQIALISSVPVQRVINRSASA